MAFIFCLITIFKHYLNTAFMVIGLEEMIDVQLLMVTSAMVIFKKLNFV